MKTTVEFVINVRETHEESSNIFVVHDKSTQENHMIPAVHIQQTENTLTLDSLPEPQYRVITEDALPENLQLAFMSLK